MAYASWLSVSEIAVHRGVRKVPIYDWIERKQMPAHKVGRPGRFRADEVDAWVLAGKAAPEGDVMSAAANGVTT